jgi:site-specific DNA-methyltransferase (adenine-specific)
MKYQIIQGDNREALQTLADNSIDAIVTDPPYGIDFLGKAWDANTGAVETYQECLRVLKPGGHILAFSAARTYHHLAVTLEAAGFEIRDQIMWIYSSGFPKSQDVGRQIHKKENGKPDKQRFDPAVMIKVSGDQYQHPDNGNIYRAFPDINGDRVAVSHEGKGYGVVYEQVIEVDSEWSGWGTQLKPAHEPIALARKPLKGSIRENCVKWGVGAINIDATRIPIEGSDTRSGGSDGWDRVEFGEAEPNKYNGDGYVPNEQGRFPSNVLGEIAEPYQKYF